LSLWTHLIYTPILSIAIRKGEKIIPTSFNSLGALNNDEHQRYNANDDETDD
jgi:hypothetical protein